MWQFWFRFDLYPSAVQSAEQGCECPEVQCQDACAHEGSRLCWLVVHVEQLILIGDCNLDTVLTHLYHWFINLSDPTLDRILKREFVMGSGTSETFPSNCTAIFTTAAFSIKKNMGGVSSHPPKKSIRAGAVTFTSISLSFPLWVSCKVLWKRNNTKLMETRKLTDKHMQSTTFRM